MPGSFYNPCYRPRRTHWRDSFYYRRVDDLPIGTASVAALNGDSLETALQQSITWHTTTNGSPNSLTWQPTGSDAWEQEYVQPYFIDSWPTGVTPVRYNYSVVNSTMSTAGPHLWHYSFRQEQMKKGNLSDYLYWSNFIPGYSLGDPTPAIYNDRHMVCWSEDTNELVEAIGYSGYSTAVEAIWTLDLNNYTIPYIPPYGPQLQYGDVGIGVIAARTPIAPFAFCYQDLIDCGETLTLGHMLGFVVAEYRSQYLWPSRGTDGTQTTGIPNGTVLRLKSSFNVNTLPNQPLRALARTLKKYGMMLYDKHGNAGQGFKLFYPADKDWPNYPNRLDAGSYFPLSSFETVDMSALKIDKHSIEVVGGGSGVEGSTAIVWNSNITGTDGQNVVPNDGFNNFSSTSGSVTYETGRPLLGVSGDVIAHQAPPDTYVNTYGDQY